MKKIGLIDYYLDEWHANHYPAWITEANAGFQVCYAYAEADVPPNRRNEYGHLVSHARYHTLYALRRAV